MWLLCSFLPRLLDSSSCFPLLQLFWVSGLQGLSPRLLHMAAVSWIPQKTQPGFWPHEHILLNSQARLWGVLWKSAANVFLIAQIISEALFHFSSDRWTPSCVLFCMAAGSMGQRHWQSPICFDLYVSILFATLIPFPLRFLGINYKGMLASEEHFCGHLIWRPVFKLLVSSIMCFVAGELQ